MPSFYSHGKLLLSGEYLVLDGACALAIPTKYGQYMHCTSTQNGVISWESKDLNGHTWFATHITINNSKVTASNNSQTDKTLCKLFEVIIQLNPTFKDILRSGWHIETQLEFPQNWGLGSSATLVNNLATWAGINPFTLLQHTLGGSGYDLATAVNQQPIFYQLNNKRPVITTCSFEASHLPHLYFVHLNKKKHTQDALESYSRLNFNKAAVINEVSLISKAMAKASTLKPLQTLAAKHEQLLSKVLGIPPVQEVLFPDFNGQIKSLGAWGGDFVWVLVDADPTLYFKKKGYPTVIPFKTMLYKKSN